MKLIKIIYLLVILFFCGINIVLAQKKSIDSNAYAKWCSVEGGSISSNGKYVTYSIENEPVGSQTLVIQSTENNWEKKIKNVPKYSTPLISKGGNYAVFLNQKDSLVIVSLGKGLVQYVSDVSSFSMSSNEESEWMAYQLKSRQKELVLQNLNTGKKYNYMKVINQVLDRDGQIVILQTEKKVEDQTLQELSWIDLNTGKRTSIFEGLKIARIVLDAKYHQMAFTSESGLFSYNMITKKLNCLMSNQTSRLDSGLIFGGIIRFSNDGERLFIELKEKDKLKSKSGLVEVWSYLDHKIQTQQENEVGARTYVAFINLVDGKIIRLEREFENLPPNLFRDGSCDTIGLITQYDSINGDWYNRKKYNYYLISLKNGKRISLKYQPEAISPNGKYLVYFDPEQHTYVSFNTRTGVYSSISKAFPESYMEPSFYHRRAVAGWFEKDEGLLFYVDYDIWRLDLSGQKAPINLTRGYGEMHHLAFSIISGQLNNPPIRNDEKIILATFNLGSKQSGFYSLELDKIKEPKYLSMGNYFYGVPWVVTIDVGGAIPIKAKKTGSYLVRRMSAEEAPNYFITKDFKTFKILSNVHPEREYKWYTTELHTWISLDGKRLQGILYKPKDFDASKKYPIIFDYYEGKSNNLYAYIQPRVLCQGCEIDIPTYVNNGYLVFTPDIVYKKGDPMQGAFDAVVSGAKYIKGLPFVNPEKMGIQGCSFGGVETNYLVTHTNLFAAACSASGLTNFVSAYGDIYPEGISMQDFFENGQMRMGKSLWDDPGSYIKNSPIFNIHMVKTPILIMHTKNDGSACSYKDAQQFFTGLRRMGKKAWLLAYPESDHGVYGKQAQDFSLRMMQFFDHYLKDIQAPIWMTTPIPLERRGTVNDLAYDTKIKTPGQGLLTSEEQQIVDSIMARKPVLIELK